MKKYRLFALAVWAVFAGCVYYPAAPGTYYTAPASGGFDRSWSAATGAFRDQGIWVTVENRSAGHIRGVRNGIDVTADVRTQADGGVKVEFNTSGPTSRDPDLINRVLASYERRMGR